MEGAPVAFIEAKGIDTPLTDKHREKLEAYLKNEDVNLGILTNSQEYEFFRRQVADSKVNVNNLATTQLQNLPDRVTILRAFTKDAIQNDEWIKILNRINELKEARITLEQEKDRLATELTELLTDSISGTISSYAESQSKEMIDRLIRDVEHEIDSNGATSPDLGRNSRSHVPKKRKELHPGRDAVTGTIKRQNIPGTDDDVVAVFPTKKSGVKFLRENNAWGFVRIGRDPEFVAMYVSEDAQQVKYIAKLKEIVPATQADLARPFESYDAPGSADAQAGFDAAKKVLLFEQDSLYELDDPIPFKNKWLQSLQYTTLGKLRRAGTTDDLF